MKDVLFWVFLLFILGNWPLQQGWQWIPFSNDKDYDLSLINSITYDSHNCLCDYVFNKFETIFELLDVIKLQSELLTKSHW